MRIAHPVGELDFPFLERQAPLRVAGHDIALAQREAAAIKILVHIEREGEESRLECFLGLPFRYREDDAVVLVSAERLLVAPFRTEGEPRPLNAVEIVVLEVELDDALGQGVVEGGDELRQLAGPDPLGQHVECKLADIGGGLLQFCNAGRRLDRLADLAQAYALQCKQVALGNDARQPALGVGHQNVADAVGGHGQHRVVGGRLLLEHEGRRRHRLADRRGLRQIGEDHAVEDVGAGEYPERLAILGGDDQRTDTRLGHHLQRLANRGVRGNRHR